jgi:protocatechuate 3,4-dioxygenase, beta subunit
MHAMAGDVKTLRAVDDAELADAAGQPRYDTPDYRSTGLRGPRKPLLLLPEELLPPGGPVYGEGDVDLLDADLTRQHGGEPLGERIVVHGRLLGSDGKPIRNALIEIWQANAAGRYVHQNDQHPAPLDPNFTGAGHALTDDDGCYRFVTIKPGAYPWRNHPNAWRPAHIHFSVFGRAFTERLVTQMYFPGDPLFSEDPIFNSVRDERARARLIAGYDSALTVDHWALGFRFDIVLRGRGQTPFEDGAG